ncbi:MAG: chemotaxis protein CheB [Candidatus Latescibacterota bacterium]|nr:chemotaxis protein CheB [Candidatus Latescibacterota bacterium]
MSKVEAIALGISTGGPGALDQLMPSLPGDLGVPVLIVQHMPSMFTPLLASMLNRRSALRVTEARDGLWGGREHGLYCPGRTAHARPVVRRGRRDRDDVGSTGAAL